MNGDAPSPAPSSPRPGSGSRPSGAWLPPSLEEMQAMLSQYVFESLLGRGGMGAVYKAVQVSLDRPVAIKVLPGDLIDDADANFLERFKNEARTMAKMNHPGIVNVYDFGETATGLLYFVMEFVDGTDVSKMIQQQGRLPPEHALAITAHVCDALGYAHKHGVVHRDIKPANVLINMEGAVKVADFGLARADDPSKTSGLTKTGLTMGTPDFVAPEALVMGVNVDGRADLYAVGVMLYQMLTGNIPRGMWTMPSKSLGTDPRFDAIIAKAMQTEREQRYQQAAEIRRDLDVILTMPMVQAGGPATSAIPQKQPPQKPVAKGPQQPHGKSARVPVRQQGQAGGQAHRLPEGDEAAGAAALQSQPVKSKPLGPIIGIAATVVIGAGLFFVFKPKAPPAADQPASASPPVVKVSEPEPPVPAPVTAEPSPLAPAASGVTPAPALAPAALTTIATAPANDAPLDPNGPPGEIKKLAGHTAAVFGVAFLPWRNDRAISGSWDKTMRLWDLKAGTELRRFEHKNFVTAIAPLMDGKHAVTTDSTLTVNLWNLETGERVKSVPLGDTSHSLSVASQGTRLLVGQDKGVVKLFLLPDLTLLRQWQADAPAPRVALSGDATRFVCGTSDGRLRFYDTNKDEPLRDLEKFAADGDAANHVVLTRNQLISVASTKKGAIYIHRIGGGVIESKIEQGGYPMDVDVIGNGMGLMTSHNNGTLIFWDGSTGRKWHELKSTAGWVTMHADVSADGRFALTGGGYRVVSKKEDDGNYDLHLWRLPQFPGNDKTAPPASTVATAPQVLSADAGGTVNLLDGIVVRRDAVEGGWSNPNGELHGKGNSQFDKFSFQASVPEEYDFRIAFTRTEGSRAVSQHLVLPNGQSVMWLMGGFDNNVCALELVNGELGNANPTTVKQGLKNGQRYESLVKVRRDRVQALLDGKLILDYPLAGSKFLVTGKWRFPDAKKLGIGCQQPTEFHLAELIPVAPPAAVASPSTPATMPAAPPAPQPAIPAPPSNDPYLARLAASFQARYDADAQKPFLAAVAALNQSYVINGIARARAAAQQKGALDEVTALDAEKARIQNNEGLPPADLDTLPAALKQLRATYRSAHAKLEADRAKKAAPLYDIYLKALDTYIVELTKANKLDEAKTVKELRENIASQKPAADTPATSAARRTPAAPATSKPEPEEPLSPSGRSRWHDAALWILSTGGRLQALKNGLTVDVQKEADIPPGKFDITFFEIDGANPKAAGIKDDDFTRLSGFKELKTVRLSSLKVSDAALAFLPTNPAISYLVLAGCPALTDAALAHIAPLQAITDLQIQDCPQFTGAGLGKLASLPVLKTLWLSRSGFTDDGARALSGARNLENLFMEVTRVTDAGAAVLGSLPKLSAWYCSDCTGITGSFLSRMEKPPPLKILSIGGNKLDPDTYSRIARIATLEMLHLDNMPGFADDDLAKLAPLKKLTTLSATATNITGATLSALKGSTGMKDLYLGQSTPIAGESIAAIAAAFPALEDLRIGSGAKLASADLRPLASLRSLKRLDMLNPAVDDAALEEVSRIAPLERLTLSESAITAKGLAALKPLKFFSSLDIPGCKQITDEAIPALKSLRILRSINIIGAGISDAGFAELKKALPAAALYR